MQGLIASYRLDGAEVQQVLMHVLQTQWARIRGDWSPTEQVQGERQTVPFNRVTLTLVPLFERMHALFTARADFTKIAACKQKEGELVDDYSIRLETVFKQHSGMRNDGDQAGPYQQQLKNALAMGLLPGIREQLTKHFVGLPTATLADTILHAQHYEKVVMNKKRQKEREAAGTAGVFVVTDDGAEVFLSTGARLRDRNRQRLGPRRDDRQK